MNAFLLAVVLPVLVHDVDTLDSVTITSYAVSPDAPVAVTSVTAERLQEQNPQKSIPMALEFEPSVLSSNEGGTGLGYSNLRIRGVGGYHTNVTLNGITLNDAESQEVFWVNIPSLANILSQMQVQRGLGTTSCGPGAFGASINMSTATPEDRPLARLSFGYGSFNTFTPSVYAGTGRSRHGLYLQAAYSYNYTDGYVQNAFARVQSIFASTGWIGSRDSFRLLFLQGRQRSGITWNGVPLEIYWHNRTWNSSVGDTDNFRQSHFQANYIHDFGGGVSWNTTLNYTKGYGYYETDGARDALDNNLWVLRSQVGVDKSFGTFTAGAYLSGYRCRHSGPAYSNDASKKEIDLFARAEVPFLKVFSSYIDVQYRGVIHKMKGPDEYMQNLDFDLGYNFFNPRLGLNWTPSSRHRLFAFFAYGNREPARADLQANATARPEHLADCELGYELNMSFLKAAVNGYYMYYTDMLVETGLLDAGGYAIKTNIPYGFRLGLEASAKAEPAEWCTMEGNATLSRNRTSSGHDILLSPSAMGMVGIVFRTPFRMEMAYRHKFVGRQFWDNGGDAGHVIPSYNVADVSITQKLVFGPVRMSLGLHVQNLWNRRYFSYAHTYGVFPQPPVNCLLNLRLEI